MQEDIEDRGQLRTESKAGSVPAASTPLSMQSHTRFATPRLVQNAALAP